MIAMDRDYVGVSSEQRARLAEKGRILYRKSCGASGKKTCAESFAQYHIGRGETAVARDLLAFLDGEAEALRTDDRDGRLAPTEELARRIRGHLQRDLADGETAPACRGTRPAEGPADRGESFERRQ
jgi:hypothetical protein